MRPTPFALRTAAVTTLLLAATGGASPAAAQAVSDSVPRDFVELLSGPAGRSEAFVGDVPDRLRTLPLPEGRLVGTLYSGPAGAIVVEVTGEARDEVSRYEGVLAAAGWTKAEPPPREGGFSSAWPTTVDQWCSELWGLSTTVLTHRQRSYVRVWVMPRANSLCEQRARVRGFTFPGRPELPPLLHPDGVRALGGGVGGSTDEVNSDASLYTELPLDVLLVHYGRQLEAAGWTLLDEAASTSLASRRYTLTDEKGDAWAGTLHLWVVAPGTVRAEVQLMTERRPW